LRFVCVLLSRTGPPSAATPGQLSRNKELLNKPKSNSLWVLNYKAEETECNITLRGQGLHHEQENLTGVCFMARGGIIVYRTFVPAAELEADSVLDLSSPVHDSAQILLDGKRLGSLDRNGPPTLQIAAVGSRPNVTSHGPHGAHVIALDIIVQGIGRSNDGVVFDTKGLASTHVTLNGAFPFLIFVTL
jgi:hypothetical protein